jgi:hypothetical protein
MNGGGVLILEKNFDAVQMNTVNESEFDGKEDEIEP